MKPLYMTQELKLHLAALELIAKARWALKKVSLGYLRQALINNNISLVSKRSKAKILLARLRRACARVTRLLLLEPKMKRETLEALKSLNDQVDWSATYSVLAARKRSCTPLTARAVCLKKRLKYAGLHPQATETPSAIESLTLNTFWLRIVWVLLEESWIVIGFQVVSIWIWEVRTGWRLLRAFKANTWAFHFVSLTIMVSK